MNPVRIQIYCPRCQYTEDYTRLLAACPNCGDGYLDTVYETKPEASLPWPGAFADRPRRMWRYRDLLPIRDPRNIVSMGEGDFEGDVDDRFDQVASLDFDLGTVGLSV